MKKDIETIKKLLSSKTCQHLTCDGGCPFYIPGDVGGYPLMCKYFNDYNYHPCYMDRMEKDLFVCRLKSRIIECFNNGELNHIIPNKEELFLLLL